MAIAPIAALEIGTSRTRMLIGEVDPQSRRVNITGHGEYPTTGVRKGLVVDLLQAKVGVENAVRQASEEGDVDVGRVILAAGGGHILASSNQGTIGVQSRDHIVTREDVEEVSELARSLNLPDDRDVMHTIAQSFNLDGQPNIVKPEGLQGAQLQLNMLIIHALRGPIENLRNVAIAAELDVEDVVFSGLCSALAVLTPDQKRNGVVVVDLGGGTTKYLAYADNVIAAAGAFAIGGDHVTNDLALAFNISHTRAEELKLKHGSAVVSASTGLARVTFSHDFGKRDYSVPLKAVHTVINARMAETLRLIRMRLHEAGILSRIGAGVVFTGGGAAMPGLVELADATFGLPCETGEPMLSGPALAEVKDLCAYATVAGLVQYGARTAQESGLMQPLQNFFGRLFSR